MYRDTLKGEFGWSDRTFLLPCGEGKGPFQRSVKSLGFVKNLSLTLRIRFRPDAAGP
jgi:hypothetical protein